MTVILDLNISDQIFHGQIHEDEFGSWDDQFEK